ncbi:MAG: damage-inducible protein DinB [Gemmatimonadetes bacterium]|nr:damage-inducible protein DinB [Gemmatimonadota bacterium]MYD13544.1 damage-inducible protein DinB [Gemmatimonadota bacterium]MYI64897.1 damage-inducible protein DinB [Gemmatimonadota bacterium]
MLSKSILPAFNQIVDGTKSVLAAVPEDQLDWRPHDKSWKLGELATHLANLPSWTMATLSVSEFDISPAGGGPPPMAALTTGAEMVAALEENAAAARGAIENCTDADLASPWTMLVAGEARFTLPKAVVLRTFIMDHMIHHRAQLGVYLRMLDVPVPQLFGPTADFPDM